MEESAIDRWAKRGVARYNSEPRWQRNFANFGFGFIFIGMLLNMAVFMTVLATSAAIDVIYEHWWATYLVFSCLAGLYWAARGRKLHTADA